jgi:hypothetical protein
MYVMWWNQNTESSHAIKVRSDIVKTIAKSNHSQNASSSQE